MSRIAKEPIVVPNGVEVNVARGMISVKGPKGSLDMPINPLVKVTGEDNSFMVTARNSSKKSRAMSGTTRSLFANMVTGVSEGFQKNLTLIGVGYRAQANGQFLNMSLGFSHPVAFEAPEGIVFEVTSESSSRVEVAIRGIDKQVVGQVAANIRKIRPPEPYKGKGVRYSDERVRRKQAKSAG